MKMAKTSIAIIYLIAFAGAYCRAEFFVRNSDSRDITFWCRMSGEKQWQNPKNLKVGDESIKLEIPGGIYQFCILGPGNTYIYTAFSEYKSGQTYFVGSRVVACSSDRKNEENEDVDKDTLPCSVYVLPSLEAEVEKPNDQVRLGVNARMCEQGIHIDSISNGTPAVKCIDRDTGEAIQIEAGDHIVAVNGVKPKSIPQFLEVIRKSPRHIELKVLDSRTGKTRHLSTKLW